MRLGPKISETVKGKLSMGARILQVGGVEKVFKQLFSLREGEKLFKASQCYLSTTAGPIAGLLFISTDKVAFCSERSIKLSSSKGELVRIHYKVSHIWYLLHLTRCLNMCTKSNIYSLQVMIPLRKIKRANQSVNVKRPSEKYIEIVTVDDFDFWFMGFLKYHKTFKYLQQAISQA